MENSCVTRNLIHKIVIFSFILCMHLWNDSPFTLFQLRLLFNLNIGQTIERLFVTSCTICAQFFFLYNFNILFYINPFGFYLHLSHFSFCWKVQQTNYHFLNTQTGIEVEKNVQRRLSGSEMEDCCEKYLE